jgi:hypothetical protein
MRETLELSLAMRIASTLANAESRETFTANCSPQAPHQADLMSLDVPPAAGT